MRGLAPTGSSGFAPGAVGGRRVARFLGDEVDVDLGRRGGGSQQQPVVGTGTQAASESEYLLLSNFDSPLLRSCAVLLVFHGGFGYQLELAQRAHEFGVRLLGG